MIYLILYCVTLRRLSLVPTCLKNRKNRGFLDAWDFHDQWEHRIPDNPDIPDVIGRIRSLSTLRVHSRRFPTSTIFTMSVNMKFARLGHREMLEFVFSCYQSLIFSELSIIKV